MQCVIVVFPDHTRLLVDQEFDRSNSHMKFGRNLMKNDKVRLATQGNRKMDRWMDKSKAIEL